MADELSFKTVLSRTEDANSPEKYVFKLHALHPRLTHFRLELYLGSLFQLVPTKLVAHGQSVEREDSVIYLQHTLSSSRKQSVEDDEEDENTAQQAVCYLAAGGNIPSRPLTVLYVRMVVKFHHHGSYSWTQDLMGGAPLRVPVSNRGLGPDARQQSLVFTKRPKESDIIQLAAVPTLEYHAILFCLHCREVADIYERCLRDVAERRNNGQLTSVPADTANRTKLMLTEVCSFLTCTATSVHSGLTLSATRQDTSIQQLNAIQRAQMVVLQTGLLDKLFAMLRTPKTVGLRWKIVANDENLSNVHRLVTRAIELTGRNNEEVQYYVARSQYTDVRSLDAERAKKVETFGYLSEVFDQLKVVSARRNRSTVSGL